MRHLLFLNERDLHHPHAGGVEVNLFAVARRLVERGYRATLLCVDFPGGRRFHFKDLTGNVLAVWTDQPVKPV